MLVPLNHHVEVSPIEQETFISQQDTTFEEKGVVVSVAVDMPDNVRIDVGDIVYFDSWLVAKYVDSGNVTRWLVPSSAIRAKETNG